MRWQLGRNADWRPDGGSACPRCARVFRRPADLDRRHGSSSPGLRLDRKARIKRLVDDGKLFYEMWRLDAAEAKLKLALKEDPHNEAAFYYLNLVSEAKFARANPSGLGESLPVPNPNAHTNLVHTSQGRQAIISKLDRIRLDSVSFDGLPLSAVVRFLADRKSTRLN